MKRNTCLSIVYFCLLVIGMTLSCHSFAVAESATPATGLVTGDLNRNKPTNSLFQTANTDTSSRMQQSFARLGYCLLGLSLLLAALKWFGPKSKALSPQRIDICSRRILGAKCTLLLTEVDGVRLLLAQSGDQVNTLHVFDEFSLQQATPSDSNAKAFSIAKAGNQ